MGTTQVTPTDAALAAKTITVKKNVFDLDKLMKVTKEVTVTLPAPLTENDLGSIPSSELVKYANAYLIKKTIKDAKNSIEGANPAVVNTFIRGFRILPMFWVDDNGAKVKDETLIDKKAQTAKIWAMLRTQPEMLEDLKSLAKSSQPTTTDDETEDDEDEDVDE